jgi:hypothetical protein
MIGPSKPGEAMPIATVLAVLLAASAASAQPLPQPKVGQCPAGYRESGGYCAPTSERAPVAIQKIGQCPIGFVQSGAAGHPAEIKSIKGFLSFGQN